RGAEAIESYRRAVALAPLNAGLRYNLGAALLEAGRSEEATQELGEAVRLDPDYAPAHTLYDAARNPAPARGN
ncbi:MAG: tetratricopeptide repeat protein, partial [Verrucomicrobia bacterium]|nr:tetratricopeptide repeat protein [Verrucomicrobiota bacterium]